MILIILEQAAHRSLTNADLNGCFFSVTTTNNSSWITCRSDCIKADVMASKILQLTSDYK